MKNGFLFSIVALLTIFTNTSHCQEMHAIDPRLLTEAIQNGSAERVGAEIFSSITDIDGTEITIAEQNYNVRRNGEIVPAISRCISRGCGYVKSGIDGVLVSTITCSSSCKHSWWSGECVGSCNGGVCTPHLCHREAGGAGGSW